MFGKSTVIVLTLFVTAGCIQGTESVSRKQRMIGGNYSNSLDFPYMVRVSLLGKRCTGVIIDREWVLTAAHCVKNEPFLIWITAGLKGEFVQCCPQNIMVSHIFPHPNYNDKIKWNTGVDIAILKLERSLIYNEYVLPIPLPHRRNRWIGYGIAVGWRNNGYDDNGPFSIAKSKYSYLNMTVMDVSSCKVTNNSLLNRMDLLYGYSELGHFQPGPGDSGGPLVRVYRNGYPELIGILAGVTNVCENFNRSIIQWVRVPLHIEWIQDVTGLKEFNGQRIMQIHSERKKCDNNSTSQRVLSYLPICFIRERMKPNVPPTLLEFMSPIFGLIYLTRRLI